MTEKREREEALRHLRSAWTELFLDPFRDTPDNKRRRAAICDKIRKWRTEK
jgi:hypothetical protein